eukprot:221742_1
MMETDVERKRRWAKIAELKKLERAERENRLKMKEKIHKYDNISISSSTSSTSSTSLFESDEEDEEKARYKRIAEMKALEKQQRIKPQENKQKQMDTLRQQITNNPNTNNNLSHLMPIMPLALPQKMSLYFNAPTQPPKKYTPKQRQTYVSNPNQVKSERISYNVNKNNDYNNDYNNDHDIVPPPQSKINENISFQYIGMKTMTVNAIEEESINDNNDIEESVNDIERALAYANN